MDKIKAFFRWLADKWYAWLDKLYGGVNAPPLPPDPAPVTLQEMAAQIEVAKADQPDPPKAA